MEIETKYNIGQSVWFVTHEGPDGTCETIPVKQGIIAEIQAHEHGEPNIDGERSVDVKYYIKYPESKRLIAVRESKIIPTADELLKRYGLEGAACVRNSSTSEADADDDIGDILFDDDDDEE